MNLIIVESPAKGVTIEKLLGKDYLVRSSYGHIRDLPKGNLGIDVEKDFEPKYVIPIKARKRVTELKKYLAKAETIILGVDSDREGEAIAWHLVQALGLNEIKNALVRPALIGSSPTGFRADGSRKKLKIKNYQRIVFHEITKQAIEEALKNPRKIDMDLVNAQQARRILDRLVGYKLSPFLWKKVVKGLSAGRVQSIAVRLVCEREKEIEKFIPQEYWTIAATLLKSKVNPSTKLRVNEFEAILTKKDDKVIPKLGIKNKEETDKILQDLEGAEYKVTALAKKEVKRNPLPPFTTSTLQQEAWGRLRFSAKKTMFVAQNLYERGFISYHRTDSLNIAEQALFGAKKFIQEKYGKEYWPGFSRTYKTKSKLAQEAHESIRPTYPDRTPDDLKLKANLQNEQLRLYDLIWRRFIACQMSSGVFDSSQIDILAKNYTFRATGQILKFDGFLKLYPMKFEENELPALEKNEILGLKELIPSQHFTQPPARYSEATLVKTLEKEGIGRPSTYAPILDTIQKRNYVAKNEQKKFQPTEIGVLVNDLLVEHFPKIVDIKFTAKMEEDLDKIAQGKENWVQTLRDFYGPFEKNLEEKYQEVPKKDLTEKTEKFCPKCGAPLIQRWGRFGKFYACSKFPECKYTEPLPKPSLGIKCPKCSTRTARLRPSDFGNANGHMRIGEIVEKRTKKGRVFYGCNQWPKCDFASWQKPKNGQSNSEN